MTSQQAFFQWRPHPWHGLETGPDPPGLVTAFIEITPLDVVKYEVDKQTGYIKVDRPQKGSSSPPTLYGFVPRTYCGARVAALADVVTADGDPLDICVISERPIDRVEIILSARVIGGFLMIDHGEADDKIVAVLDEDPVFDDAQDLADIPAPMIDRIEHYFLTYKSLPGEEAAVDVRRRYRRDHALVVVEASIADYEDAFGS